MLMRMVIIAMSIIAAFAIKVSSAAETRPVVALFTILHIASGAQKYVCNKENVNKDQPTSLFTFYLL